MSNRLLLGLLVAIVLLSFVQGAYACAYCCSASSLTIVQSALETSHHSRTSELINPLSDTSDLSANERSFLEGRAYRHGDIEDILSVRELPRRRI